MNLASICRYLLRFPLLCRKWVWLSWSLSSLEWSQRPVLPWCLTFSVDAASDQAYVAFKHVASNMFVFQQDNAASHRARTPLNSYSKKRRTSLVLISGRAQNSPAELNLVDYSFLGAVRHRVHECRMNSVDELKLRLIDVWNSLQQNVIRGQQRVEKATESMHAWRWTTFWTLIASACD